MNCYYCEKTSGPGGTHLHVVPAVGVCRHCGAAVCLEHGAKSPEAGALLLCRECAALETVPSAVGHEAARTAAA